MTAYLTFPKNASVDPPRGGIIRSASNDIAIPQQLSCTPTGAALGPVYLGVPNSGGVCSIDRLDYLPGDDDGSGLLAVSVAAGTGEGVRRRADGAPEWIEAPDVDPSTTRRGLLGMFAGVLALGLFGDNAAAQTDDESEEEVTLRMAEVDVSGVTDPLSVRVIDVIDAVLPPTAEILVDADDTRVGEVTEPGEGVVLPTGTEGTIRIYLRDARSRLAALLAWVSGFLRTDEELVFKRELPKEATEYSDAEFVRLTEHPAITGPIADADPDEVILTVGNTQIPHADDRGSSEAGQWTTVDDALVYETGENPPASSSWEIRIGVGIFDQLTA
ncbi:hypothetical protein C471_09440 [Halorubrum saccharovorum DSM 1137]|uniref:Uncharacterized protein n=1 Tax=Halorubrum saccharovorum DSM 1137 TaxID=1227484 RepID=M0DVC8_9EURY|nr:hypothetical protein [Halorubrum saccharovorum]ELZ38783.1 hypothetical protein C471_09440 [Halorubrum saccharovorum DSM 1137]